MSTQTLDKPKGKEVVSSVEKKKPFTLLFSEIGSPEGDEIPGMEIFDDRTTVDYSKSEKGSDEDPHTDDS